MIFKTKTLLHFVLILFAIIVKESFGSSVPATTLYGTISKTTTTFFTPPIVTSTLFTTSTPATSVKIITITGKIVKTINQVVTTEGFLSREITWDGKDDFGDKIGKGVYIYKLTVRSTISNNKAEKIEKLVIL